MKNCHVSNVTLISLGRTDFKYVMCVKFVVLTVSLAYYTYSNLCTCALIYNILYYCKNIVCFCAI